LGSDSADKASGDVGRCSGSRSVEGSAALDGAAVAAIVDDRGSQCRGVEGSNDKESNFGKHLE